MKNTTTRSLTVAAMLSAVAFILQFIEFPLPMLIPSFVKWIFRTCPPCWGVCPGAGIRRGDQLYENLLHIVIKGTSTACVGELCNFCWGRSLQPPPVLYQRRKTALPPCWECWRVLWSWGWSACR